MRRRGLARNVDIGPLHLGHGLRLPAYHWVRARPAGADLHRQFFSFVESQFHAVFGLAFNVALLITVRSMIRREEERDDAPAAAAPTPLKPIPAELT